jgi:transposase
MLIKTVLNRLELFKSFVFGSVTFQVVNGSDAMVVEIKARANSKHECPECGKRCKKRDMQPGRLFEALRLFLKLSDRCGRPAG